MRILLFARRNIKEVLRDPINLFFGLGFPLVIMLLLSVISSNIPPEEPNMFAIQSLAPGIAVFGLTFITLFSGMILSKDRGSSFLMRLFTSPMTPSDFIFGYTLPMVLLSLAQSVITFLAAGLFGFTFSLNILLALLVLFPMSLFFTGLGFLCGSLLNEKAVGGVLRRVGYKPCRLVVRHLVPARLGWRRFPINCGGAPLLPWRRSHACSNQREHRPDSAAPCLGTCVYGSGLPARSVRFPA